MKSIVLSATLLFGLLLPLGKTFAADICELNPWDVVSDPLTARRLILQLKEKNFGAVEDELNHKLMLYREGKFSDARLYRDLELISDEGVALEPLMLEWTKNRPDSYFAFLLKGMNHTRVGHSKRGTAFISKTSPEQVNAMRDESEKAVSAIARAIEIDKDTGLGYAAMIAFSKFWGEKDGVGKVRLEALRHDPKSLAVTRAAAIAFNPKWGGSFEQLDSLAEQAKKLLLPEVKTNLILYWVEMEKSNYQLVVNEKKSEAIRYAVRANEYCPSVRSLWDTSGTAMEIEDWESVRRITTTILSLAPMEDAAWERRGKAFEKLGKVAKAIPDYQNAADLGNQFAKAWLQKLNFNGESATQEMVSVKASIDQAAAQGDAEAQQVLCTMYSQGTGVGHDLVAAFRWCTLAAQQGAAMSQSVLGTMYMKGQGAPLDSAEGRKWFRLAAQQGYWRAQLTLGQMYRAGKDVPIDYSEAAKWFRMYSQGGRGQIGQEFLGDMYARGQGVPVDGVKALMWFTLSALSGSKTAAANSTGLEKQLTAEKILQAKLQLSDCMYNRLKGCD